MLSERPQNDKVPKNFLILNLAPAAESATAVKAPMSPPVAQSQAAVPRPPAAVASAAL